MIAATVTYLIDVTSVTVALILAAATVGHLLRSRRRQLERANHLRRLRDVAARQAELEHVHPAARR